MKVNFRFFQIPKTKDTISNNGVIFLKVPEAGPVTNEHFKFVERKINISSTVLEKDEILVKNIYMSLDPYMRGRMRQVIRKVMLKRLPWEKSCKLVASVL